MNGDVWCDWDPAAAPGLAASLPDGGAWLLMVDNPAQHPNGDFRLAPDGSLHVQGEPRLTYAGIAAGDGPGPGARRTPYRPMD
ncbi:hypothetical protein G6F57_022791 [Rhizopus arrhizus]|nr:hypothetical protein G6F57_022791 [Rhizopus arrhizus]